VQEDLKSIKNVKKLQERGNQKHM